MIEVCFRGVYMGCIVVYRMYIEDYSGVCRGGVEGRGGEGRGGGMCIGVVWWLLLCVFISLRNWYV